MFSSIVPESADLPASLGPLVLGLPPIKPPVLPRVTRTHPTMAGPLFSLTASGTIGNVLTFQQHRGTPYARRKPVPADKTTPQLDPYKHTLNVLYMTFQQFPHELVSPWKSRYSSVPGRPGNQWLKTNLPTAYQSGNTQDLEWSPGRGSPNPPQTLTAAVAGPMLGLATTPPPTDPQASFLSFTWLIVTIEPIASITIVETRSQETAPFVPTATFGPIPPGLYQAFVWAQWETRRHERLFSRQLATLVTIP